MEIRNAGKQRLLQRLLFVEQAVIGVVHQHYQMHAALGRSAEGGDQPFRLRPVRGVAGRVVREVEHHHHLGPCRGFGECTFHRTHIHGGGFGIEERIARNARAAPFAHDQPVVAPHQVRQQHRIAVIHEQIRRHRDPRRETGGHDRPRYRRWQRRVLDAKLSRPAIPQVGKPGGGGVRERLLGGQARQALGDRRQVHRLAASGGQPHGRVETVGVLGRFGRLRHDPLWEVQARPQLGQGAAYRRGLEDLIELGGERMNRGCFGHATEDKAHVFRGQRCPKTCTAPFCP